MDRPIVALAAWFSRPVGFVVTCGVMAVGLGLGVALSFHEDYTLAYNLALSITALVISGLILVSGAKDTAAIQAKLDELLRSIDKADDSLVGIDQASTEELERSGRKDASLERSTHV